MGSLFIGAVRRTQRTTVAYTSSEIASETILVSLESKECIAMGQNLVAANMQLISIDSSNRTSKGSRVWIDLYVHSLQLHHVFRSSKIL